VKTNKKMPVSKIFKMKKYILELMNEDLVTNCKIVRTREAKSRHLAKENEKKLGRKLI
jgi:hypothetical protein